TEKSPRGFVYVSSDSVLDHYCHRVRPSAFSDDNDAIRTHRNELDKARLNQLMSTSLHHELQRTSGRRSLHASRFQYSSKAQRSYDNLHRVQYRHGIFFALRGNVRSPEKIIFTFAQPQDAKATIRYPMLHLGNISDIELTETLIVAIQPRLSEARHEINSKMSDYSARLLSFVRDVVARSRSDDSRLVFISEAKSSADIAKLVTEFPRASTIALHSSVNTPFPETREIYFDVDQTGTCQKHSTIAQSSRIWKPKDFILHAGRLGKSDLVSLASSDEATRETLFFRFSVDQHSLSLTVEPTLFAIVRYLLDLHHPTAGAPISELRVYSAQAGSGVQIRVDVEPPYESHRQWFLEFRKGDQVIFAD